MLIKVSRLEYHAWLAIDAYKKNLHEHKRGLRQKEENKAIRKLTVPGLVCEIKMFLAILASTHHHHNGVPLQLTQHSLRNAVVTQMRNRCHSSQTFQDLGTRFGIQNKVVSVFELHTEGLHCRFSQSKITVFPDVLGYNNILLAVRGKSMMEQTIGLVAGVPFCLGAVINKDNIMIHVA